MSSEESAHRWLEVLGLHRRELRAWCLYDWANSAFATTIMAAVLPIFYLRVAAVTLPENVRTAYWAYTQTVALAIIAAISPFLGAAADYLGAKKKFLAAFAAAGILGSFLLYFIREGEWLYASAVFILGNIGFAVGNVFYESLLPHIARSNEIDRVSTAGYAIGYVGGGALLAVNLLWISYPQRFGMADASQATRVAFLSVAVWWGLFTVPLLRTVPEPPPHLEPDEKMMMNPLRVGSGRVIETFHAIRRHRHAFVFLLAFWFYNDGINTIIKMATAYGTEIGIGQNHLIGALLLVQFLGIPFTFAYGVLANRIGAKNGIYLALCVYTGISVLGYFMTRPWHFWALACAVAFVQGGSQALSRSLYATLIPSRKSSEFFGFYSISGKFGNIVGPLVFGVVSQLTGGSRLSILALVTFFLVGMILLSRVDVEEGRGAVLAEETEVPVAE
ncbi:MAG: MFS transporter [Acidobacteriota bacterium]